MTFMDHIETCNRHDLSKFVPFKTAEGKALGWIRKDHLAVLRSYPDVLVVAEHEVQLVPRLDTYDAITHGINNLCEDLRGKGWFKNWRNEPYRVSETFAAAPVFQIERAATSFFGIRAFGVHLNGYVKDETGLKLWVAQRAHDRAICPGQLDNMVAGGQPAHLSLQENLIKECAEEANIPIDLAKKAKPVGMISYVMESDDGLKPDTMFCYDLEVPQDFIPVNTDGEVEKFVLWPIEQVAKVLSTSDDFKFNCNLVILDFLIRHGVLTPDETNDYEALVKGLRG
jgi:8-oxo-dGTP pyrophosphatase MutT (NUDIX family)